MKKAVLVILAFLYITTAAGIVVNIHYCMGDVASVGYGHEEEDACGKCGMEENEKKGCCHTEHKWVKLQDAHQPVTAGLPLLFFTPALPVPTGFTTTGFTADDQYFFRQYHSPPDIRANSIYLYNSIFRI